VSAKRHRKHPHPLHVGRCVLGCGGQSRVRTRDDAAIRIRYRHEVLCAVEVLDGGGVVAIAPCVGIGRCATTYSEGNRPVAGSGAGGDGDLRGGDDGLSIGDDFKSTGLCAIVLISDRDVKNTGGKVADGCCFLAGVPVVAIHSAATARIQHNTAIVLLPADIGDLRLQIQHLLAGDCGASLCCAAVGVGDGEAVFAGGEVVDKIVGSAGAPGVGVGRGAGGDFCQGDDTVVGTSAGGCGRQEEGIYDGAGANFGGEGDGAAVGVGEATSYKPGMVISSGFCSVEA